MRTIGQPIRAVIVGNSHAKSLERRGHGKAGLVVKRIFSSDVPESRNDKFSTEPFSGPKLSGAVSVSSAVYDFSDSVLERELIAFDATPLSTTPNAALAT